jgi:hypothetical protein
MGHQTEEGIGLARSGLGEGEMEGEMEGFCEWGN